MDLETLKAELPEVYEEAKTEGYVQGHEEGLAEGRTEGEKTSEEAIDAAIGEAEAEAEQNGYDRGLQIGYSNGQQNERKRCRHIATLANDMSCHQVGIDCIADGEDITDTTAALEADREKRTALGGAPDLPAPTGDETHGQQQQPSIEELDWEDEQAVQKAFDAQPDDVRAEFSEASVWAAYIKADKDGMIQNFRGKKDD